MGLPSLNATARVGCSASWSATRPICPSTGTAGSLLPPELREFAQLERHGMLIGQGNRFELWDEAALERAARRCGLQTEEAATDLPSELESLSL